MYSAYNQGQQHEDAPNDLMFLSDSLHNFDQLGHAIQEGRSASIVAACDSLLTAYGRYQTEDPRFGSRQGKRTFDRNAERVSLEEAVDIFNDIRTKVSALL